MTLFKFRDFFRRRGGLPFTLELACKGTYLLCLFDRATAKETSEAKRIFGDRAVDKLHEALEHVYQSTHSSTDVLSRKDPPNNDQP